jgi:hypothetical protein
MPYNASYTRFFFEGFSYVLQIDMHFICTPIWTKFYSYEKWVLHLASIVIALGIVLSVVATIGHLSIDRAGRVEILVYEHHRFIRPWI